MTQSPGTPTGLKILLDAQRTIDEDLRRDWAKSLGEEMAKINRHTSRQIMKNLLEPSILEKLTLEETPMNSAIRIAQRNDPVKFVVIPEDNAHLINTLLAIHEITGLIPSIELIREAAGKVPRVRLDGSILRPGEVVYREPGSDNWSLLSSIDHFCEAFHECANPLKWDPEDWLWPDGMGDHDGRA